MQEPIGNERDAAAIIYDGSRAMVPSMGIKTINLRLVSNNWFPMEAESNGIW